MVSIDSTPATGSVSRAAAPAAAPPSARLDGVGEALDTEYRTLQRRAHIGRAHWAILGLSVLLTLSAWQACGAFVHDRAADRFERQRARAVDMVQARVSRYEDVLRFAAGMVNSHGSRVSRAQWHDFVVSLDLLERYPGSGALSLATAVPAEGMERFVAEQRGSVPGFVVHPRIDQPLHLPLTHVEPAPQNASAIGLDLLYEENRRRTILASRDDGELRITVPLSLMLGNTLKPGVIFMAPLYRGTPDTVERRRASFSGLVTLPFLVSELVQGGLARELRQVSLSILDGEATVHDELQPDAPSHDPDPVFSERTVLALHGRRWLIDVRTDLDFRAEAGLHTPRVVLLVGLGLNGALLLVFSTMSGANRRALAFAARTAEASHDHLASLKRSNQELESFAHVVSHDLKTPLRGIGDLIEYLGEDLQETLQTQDLPADISRNLQRLDTQQRRMTELIDGILGFSALGREQMAVQSLDTGEVLRAVAADFALDEGRFTVRGPLPVFDTQPVRFRQVMHNLVGNALKHHDDPANLRIEVEVAQVPGGWSFAVSDNGPGIHPRFHASVFEVFKKLRSKDEVEGSGVGLSIVQRSVELLGGHVRLASAPGEGARFTVFWPEAGATLSDGVAVSDGGLAPLAEAA